LLEATMLRERILKGVLVLLGLLFSAGIYPIAMTLWHPDPSEDKGDFMMLSLYVTLGVLLLIAARNRPSTAVSSRSLRGPVSLTLWSWAPWHSSFRTIESVSSVGQRPLSSSASP
jgi:hypothetical protein